MSALGHKPTCSALADVRFTPKSGHVRCNGQCPLWSNSGHPNERGDYNSLSLITLAVRLFEGPLRILRGPLAGTVPKFRGAWKPAALDRGGAPALLRSSPLPVARPLHSLPPKFVVQARNPAAGTAVFAPKRSPHHSDQRENERAQSQFAFYLR